MTARSKRLDPWVGFPSVILTAAVGTSAVEALAEELPDEAVVSLYFVPLRVVESGVILSMIAPMTLRIWSYGHETREFNHREMTRTELSLCGGADFGLRRLLTLTGSNLP